MHLFQLFKVGEIMKIIKSEKSFYIKLVVVCIAVIISATILYYIMSPIQNCLRAGETLIHCTGVNFLNLSW